MQLDTSLELCVVAVPELRPIVIDVVRFANQHRVFPTNSTDGSTEPFPLTRDRSPSTSLDVPHQPLHPASPVGQQVTSASDHQLVSALPLHRGADLFWLRPSAGARGVPAPPHLPIARRWVR